VAIGALVLQQLHDRTDAQTVEAVACTWAGSMPWTSAAMTIRCLPLRTHLAQLPRSVDRATVGSAPLSYTHRPTHCCCGR
jgi:hypothetical protein